MDEDDLYRYRARYIKNYDGDTIDVNIDLGLGCWKMGERLRLYGIDTPEMRGGTDTSKAKAREAKNFVSRALSGAMDVLIETVKDKTGKYGRLLAVVWYMPVGGAAYANLNDELVSEGLAQRKAY